MWSPLKILSLAHLLSFLFQGGGHITVTFPESVPGGRILVTLKGTCLEHHLTADKVDDNTVSVSLPGTYLFSYSFMYVYWK